jgi:hypothetical protein
MSRLVLTFLSELFSGLTALYPNIGELFQKTIHDAKLDSIKTREFKSRKDRLIMIRFLFDQLKALDLAKRRELIQLVIVKDDLQGVRRVIDGSGEEDAGVVMSKVIWVHTTVRNLLIDATESHAQKLIKQGRDSASRMTDPEFLLYLRDIPDEDETLKTAVTSIKNIIQSHFTAIIPKLLKSLVHKAAHLQQEDIKKQIRREASSEAHKDASRFRTEFICEIEKHSQSESTLYVVLACANIFSSNIQASGIPT